MSITLDTPEQISMWVLLSRRGQIKMHLKGYPVKGLATCLKRMYPEVGGRTVKDFVVANEFAISEAGGTPDYSLVNVHVMLSRGGLFFDRGIFSSMDEAGTVENRVLFNEGRLEVVLTMEEPREPNGQTYVGA